MNISILLPLFGILVGGVFLASQAPINAALARSLSDPILAACISFGIGFVVLEHRTKRQIHDVQPLSPGRGGNRAGPTNRPIL